MLEEIFSVIGEFFLEAMLTLTRHATLWTITLGRWKVHEGRDFVAITAGFLVWVLAFFVVIGLIG